MFSTLVKNTPSCPIALALEHMNTQFTQYSDSLPQDLMKITLSTESASDQQSSAIGHSAYENINSMLSSFLTNPESSHLAETISMESNQAKAAAAAGMLGTNPSGYFKREMKPMVIQEGKGMVVQTNTPGTTTQYSPSFEAYDERENRAASAYSYVYNLFSATQDDFGEGFFPTIVQSPDHVGFGVTVQLMHVHNEFLRDISGAVTEYGEQNLLRAYADPDILKNGITKVIPVVRSESVGNFVDASVIAPRTIQVPGSKEEVQTAPLAVGKRVDLIGISQTDSLLAAGVMDVTDSLDTAIVLDTVYIKVGDDVLAINTAALPLSSFNYMPQGTSRKMVVNFDTSDITLTKDTKAVDSSDLVTLAAIKNDELGVRIRLEVSGTVDLEKGDCSINPGKPEISIVRNSTNEIVPLTTAPANALVTAFADAEVIGYDIDVNRANLNRRQRGHLIRNSTFTQGYDIPLHSPIAAIHPTQGTDNTDASDLATLITTTHIRISNSAVDTLLDAAKALRGYKDVGDSNGAAPAILGVGRLLVKPVYFYANVNMEESVDSEKSHERGLDIQSFLINKVRDFAYQMYRDSEYKSADDAMNGGKAPKPTIVVGTDPVIARYLTRDTQLTNQLGDGFEIMVVETTNKKMKGKLMMTFTKNDGGKNNQPNPLSFGNFAWAPELTLVAPMTRNGAQSKELVVQPRFLHIVNLPILTEMDIKGIPEVLEKVTSWRKDVSEEAAPATPAGP